MTAPETAPTWLTSDAVATRAARSTSTVRLAAVTKQLHGHQSTRDGKPIRKGKWVFHTAAVDAWLHGYDLRAQVTACGCEVVTTRQRRMRVSS